MTATCARPGCGQALPAPARGPRPTFCSDRCRKAAGRAAVEAASVGIDTTPVRSFDQRPSYRGADYGDGDRCPQDPTHGRMYFAKPAMQRQWCPSSRHQASPFYQRDGVTSALPAGSRSVEASHVGTPADVLPAGSAVPTASEPGPQLVASG